MCNGSKSVGKRCSTATMLQLRPLTRPPVTSDTHLPNRRPPACMWLWTVCQRPALLPPVTMLRTLSLRLGPSPVPEQAPPLSLAPSEGPAPPCPLLSTAPLGGRVGVDRKHGNTDRQEERTKSRFKGERRGRGTDERQTHRPGEQK